MPAAHGSTPPRRRRLLRLAFAVVVGLPLLAALAVQIVLWTDLPRQRVEALLSARSGLDVHLDALTVRWSGRSTVRGCSAALPSADPFVTAPEVEVRHAPVLALLLGRPLGLRSVEARGPDLTLRRAADGAWEIVRVVDGVPGDGGGAEPLRLPNVRARDATVRVDMPDASPLVFDALDVAVDDDPPGTLAVSLARGRSTVSGSLAIDERLAHRVDFDMPDAKRHLAGIVAMPEGHAVRGSWSGSLEAGRLVGHLQAQRLSTGGDRLSADLQLSADDGGAGPLTLAGDVDGRYRDGEGKLDIRARLDARGPRWGDVEIDLAFPELALTDETGTLRFDGFALSGGVRDGTIEVTRASLPKADRSELTGRFDIGDGTWSVDLHVFGWNLRPGATPVTSFELVASGDPEAVTIDTLHMVNDVVETRSTGTYAAARLPALQLRQIVLLGDHDDRSDRSTATTGPGVRADLDLAGSLLPLQLSYDGRLEALRIPMVVGAIERVELPCRGEVTGERLAFTTDAADLFGGSCRAEGAFGWTDRMLAFTVDGSGVALEALLPMLDAPFDGTGRLAASLAFEMPNLDSASLALSGTWSVGDFTVPPFEADHASGRVAWDGTVLSFSNGAMQRGDGTLDGSASFTLGTKVMQFDLACRRWPFDVPDSTVRLLNDGTFRSGESGHPVDLSTTILVADQEIGAVVLAGRLDDTTLLLDRLEGTVAGGRLSSSGTMQVDDWTRTTAELSWNGADLGIFSDASSSLPSLSGRGAFDVRVRPSEDRRFPDALDLSFGFEPDGAKLAEAVLGPASARAFLAPERQSLAQATVALAAGTIELSGWQNPGRGYGQLFVDAEGIELQQIARSLGSDKLFPGRLAGSGSLTSPTNDAPLVGTAGVQVTEADLGKAAIVSAIYGAMRLDFSEPKPTGAGSAQLRLDGRRLLMDPIQFHNRGAGLSGRIELGDLAAGGAGPISGIAIGSLRPLGGIDLPVIRQLDRLTEMLQGTFTSARVGGTLGDIRTVIVPFARVADQVGGLIAPGP